MRILFLTDNFPPEVNAPASRTHEHCREWVQAGHDVTVITCAPNFPKGQVFPGYRNAFRQTSIVDGVRVVRVWSYITANEGFLRRSLDYLSFMVTSTIAGVCCRRPDIVVGTSPQLFTACAAYLVSRLRRRPFVFELRDLWPESIRAVGVIRSRWILGCLEWLELFLYRSAVLIVALTDAFSVNLVRRGIPREKIAVITNGVDLARYAPRARDPELVRQLELQGKFVAGYIGTHGLAHGLQTILDAAEIVLRSTQPDRHVFLLLGNGACKAALQREAGRRNLRNVRFVDSVGKDEVVRYWSLLDVSVIHLIRDPVFETVIPSKLFESMAMGVPVLLGVEGEAAAIVRQHDVGLCFQPGSAQELVLALDRLREDNVVISRFRNACIQAAGQFDRRRLAARMLESLQALA